MATSLEILKKISDLLSARKMPSFSEMCAKISPVDPEIICLGEMIKKDK